MIFRIYTGHKKSEVLTKLKNNNNFRRDTHQNMRIILGGKHFGGYVHFYWLSILLVSMGAASRFFL